MLVASLVMIQTHANYQRKCLNFTSRDVALQSLYCSYTKHIPPAQAAADRLEMLTKSVQEILLHDIGWFPFYLQKHNHFFVCICIILFSK